MTAYAVVQGVPLSLDTREALKAYGWIILRARSVDEITSWFNDRGRQDWVVFNAGLSQFTTKALHGILQDILLINPGEQIKRTRRPMDIRNNLGEFLPPIPTVFPAQIWVKGPGRQGNNKEVRIVDKQPPIPEGWDIQEHVEGTEYRAVTVGDKVVQVFERFGTVTEREYHWVGVSEGPSKVIGIAKRAAATLPEPSILAWDIILTEEEDKAYILEANTAPGLSAPTAARVTNMVNSLYVEEDEL